VTTPDFQTLFNIALAIISGLFGMVIQGLRDSMANLQKADNELAAKVQSIEVLVAGTYVKRDDMDKLGTALFAKLDKIEAKLDSKADKP
jgi:hypothetical protein